MRLRCCLAFILSVAAVGCDAKLDHFPRNELYAVSLGHTFSVDTETATLAAHDAVEQVFGTPNDPRWPAELVDASAVDIIRSPDRLKLAVGMVASDQTDRHQGLYREHCVRCHGIAGGGAGPAALFQNPYPRNFRHGVFKWKSTVRNAKPTRADLLSLLQRGVPGTSMPSFAILGEDEQQTLVDYVIFLAVRGEVERKLMAVAVDQLGYDQSVPEDADLRQSVAEVVRAVTGSWADAESQVVPVRQIETSESVAVALADAERIERGQKIFEGQVANCVGCHGVGGRGGVDTLDYDDWTKEYTTRAGITPSDRDAVRPLKRLGALTPRIARPRDLTEGVFRGAAAPETIYRRITQGIAGTPMPSVGVSDQSSATSLTRDQVWDLVAYVLSLGSSEIGSLE